MENNCIVANAHIPLGFPDSPQEGDLNRVTTSHGRKQVIKRSTPARPGVYMQQSLAV